jgi:Fe-S oxidoreductase/nitrate reductase gamma subunit
VETWTREIYWNIAGEALIYAFFAASLGFAAWGIARRARLWRLGGPEARLDRIGARHAGVLADVLGQRRALRDRWVGLAHALVFYGFLVETLATSLIALQEWTGVHFLRGRFYLGYSLVSDVFGLLALAGLAGLLWRRAVLRPARLHSLLDDWIALALLLLVFAQGFVVEGLRIAATELATQPALARWSPGGYAVALALRGLDESALRSLHRFAWWFHAATAFALLGYFVWGKLAHAVFGTANVFLRNLEGTGRLAHEDLEALAERDEAALERLGTTRIDQWSWKQLLDLDACMNCGRCEEVCPAHLAGGALSPRKLVRDLHDHLGEVGPALLAARAAGSAPEGALTPLVGPAAAGGAAPAVLDEEVWGCRTCGACQQACPVFIEHVPKLVDLRRGLVMTESRMGEGVQQMLRSLDDRMHPWVGSSRDREAWFADLPVKVFSRGDRAEWLFWVGCTGALVERNVLVTRAIAKVLLAGGVDFAVLGAEEACSGDPARRVGGELTYQACAKTNLETFARYGISRVVTACPHCMNTLRHEYRDFGGRLEVVHHTQLIADLAREGRLRLRQLPEALTYHDPCYLGRHNGVYDEPRELLRVVGDGRLREMPRSRERSLCCGAGGGHAFMDDAAPRRVNQLRAAEARQTGARSVAVSCPFCLQMFEDGLGALEPERATRAVDVAELVAEALEEPR